ncbi:MAG: acylphosphatase [Spirochaetales bacterium]|nr:acylphosphatase [Spirochaetales bacterium]
MKTPAGKAMIARVTGIVQGVGFRYSTVHEAGRLGLTGWVRNTNDGAVEVLAEGSPEAVAALTAWLRRGPPGAYVRNVSVADRPFNGSYDRFSVEY